MSLLLCYDLLFIRWWPASDASERSTMHHPMRHETTTVQRHACVAQHRDSFSRRNAANLVLWCFRLCCSFGLVLCLVLCWSSGAWFCLVLAGSICVEARSALLWRRVSPRFRRLRLVTARDSLKTPFLENALARSVRNMLGTCWFAPAH